MKNFKRLCLFTAAALVLLAGQSAAAGGQDIPKAGMPILTTSAGQSSDVMTLNIVAEEAGLKYDFCDVPNLEMLSAGVGLAGKESGPGFHVEVHSDLDKYPTGTPYKCVLFAIGASLKGMGASGLTIEDEEKRLKEIIDYCKKNEIFIIGIHVGGVSKRGAPGGDNERMIEAVAPFSDYLIVAQDSNKDGRFTTIAEENKIPLKEIEYALGLVDVLKQVFQE